MFDRYRDYMGSRSIRIATEMLDTGEKFIDDTNGSRIVEKALYATKRHLTKVLENGKPIDPLISTRYLELRATHEGRC